MEMMTAVKPIDDEERILMEEAEAGLFAPVSQETKDVVMRAVEKSKTKVISIRLNGQDLELIKEKADMAGMPYQTLINSVLHRYLSGEILIKNPI